jgi:hypothetical protein
MDLGQKNSINQKCYKCEYIHFFGNTYICGNKYACVNNDKLKRNKAQKGEEV